MNLQSFLLLNLLKVKILFEVIKARQARLLYIPQRTHDIEVLGLNAPEAYLKLQEAALDEI